MRDPFILNERISEEKKKEKLHAIKITLEKKLNRLIKTLKIYRASYLPLSMDRKTRKLQLPCMRSKDPITISTTLQTPKIDI